MRVRGNKPNFFKNTITPKKTIKKNLDIIQKTENALNEVLPDEIQIPSFRTQGIGKSNVEALESWVNDINSKFNSRTLSLYELQKKNILSCIKELENSIDDISKDKKDNKKQKFSTIINTLTNLKNSISEQKVKSNDGFVQPVKIVNLDLETCLDKLKDYDATANFGGNEYKECNVIQERIKDEEIAEDSALKRLISTYDFFLSEFNLATDLESVQTVKNPLIKEGREATVIGDIHGDMNVLLTGLMGSGLIKLENPPIMMYKMGKENHKCSIEDFLDLNEVEQKKYQPIPNFSFIEGAENQEIVCLGDILDRGEHDQVCLALLKDLAERDHSPLKIVIGDHEVYGLINMDSCNLPLSPSNYSQLNKKQLVRCNDEQFQLVRDTLKQAMNKQTIKFAHLSDTGMLYSHSMFEKEWLEKQGTEILDQMKSEKKEENEIQKVDDSFNFLISMTDLNESNYEAYKTALTVVIHELNEKLKILSLSEKPNGEVRNQMFWGDSPLWSRGKNPIVPLLMCVGHTNQQVFESNKLIENPLKTISEGENVEENGKANGSNGYLLDMGSFFTASKRGGNNNKNSVPIITKVKEGQLEVQRVRADLCRRMLYGYVGKK